MSVKKEWKEFYRVTKLDPFANEDDKFMRVADSYEKATELGKKLYEQFKIDKYFLHIDIPIVYEYRVVYRRHNGRLDVSASYYISMDEFCSFNRDHEFVEFVQSTKRERI